MSERSHSASRVCVRGGDKEKPDRVRARGERALVKNAREPVVLQNSREAVVAPALRASWRLALSSKRTDRAMHASSLALLSQCAPCSVLCVCVLDKIAPCVAPRPCALGLLLMMAMADRRARERLVALTRLKASACLSTDSASGEPPPIWFKPNVMMRKHNRCPSKTSSWQSLLPRNFHARYALLALLKMAREREESSSSTTLLIC